jgi:flagellar basal-body rod protein FlgF
MSNSINISLSGLMALERRLEVIAHNVANTNTTGFRADGIRFATDIERAGKAALSFADKGGTFLDTGNGALVATGNPLDVALSGDGWLARENADASGAVYTRDGRITLDPEGTLRSVDGAAYLDAGGAPLQLNPKGGPAQVTADGVIFQDGRRVGVFGVFALADEKRITRAGATAVSYEGFAEAVTDLRRTRIISGHIESSNVTAVDVMAEMIVVTRSFEGIANAMRAQEDLLSAAIKALGPQG